MLYRKTHRSSLSRLLSIASFVMLQTSYYTKILQIAKKCRTIAVAVFWSFQFFFQKLGLLDTIIGQHTCTIIRLFTTQAEDKYKYEIKKYNTTNRNATGCYLPFILQELSFLENIDNVSAELLEGVSLVSESFVFLLREYYSLAKETLS